MKKLASLTTFILLFSFSQLWAQATVIDSLKNELTQVTPDSVKVNLLIELSIQLRRSAPNAALEYATEAFELAQEVGFEKGEAQALKYIGMAYYFQGKYIETIDYWEQARVVFDNIGDLVGVSNMENNIGAVYFNQGDDNRAINHYLESLEVAQEINEPLRIATAYINIGNVFMNKSITYKEALDYFQKALPICIELNDLEAYGTTTVNMGEIFFKQNQVDSALYYFNLSYEALVQIDGNTPYVLMNIGRTHLLDGDMDQARENLERALLLATERGAKLEMAQSLIGLAKVDMNLKKYRIAIDHLSEGERITQAIGARNERMEVLGLLSASFANLNEYATALTYQIEYVELRDTIYNAENEKRIAALIQGNEIDQQKSQIQVQDLTIQKQRFAKNAFLVGLLTFLLVSFIIFRNYRQKVKINRILDLQKAEIERLILNILPKSVADELQKTGKATPRYYDHVSVLFTDFKGFSRIAGNLSPQELVEELNQYFVAFDNIVEKYGLEKIKTIGDAYMCACGLPTEDPKNAIKAVQAGLEMQEYINQKNSEKKEKGLSMWDLRIGIHTGPIVAGVVGRKKYAYDIWGDTVNIASRMESNGEEGLVNISASTFNDVKEIYKCTYRGKIEAKNIGTVDMYFIQKSQ